jgi:hypothetical protein
MLDLTQYARWSELTAEEQAKVRAAMARWSVEQKAVVSGLIEAQIAVRKTVNESSRAAEFMRDWAMGDDR